MIFNRSLIAAYLGNIIGALIVALPAVYWYLDDYHPDDLESAEAGAYKLGGLSRDGSSSTPPIKPEGR